MNDLNACAESYKGIKKSFGLVIIPKLFFAIICKRICFLLQIQFFRHHVKVDKVHSDGKQYSNYKGYIHAW